MKTKAKHKLHSPEFKAEALKLAANEDLAFAAKELAYINLNSKVGKLLQPKS